MSLMNANKAAGLIVFKRPNSSAALNELVKSLPAFASARTCAPELCACRR